MTRRRVILAALLAAAALALSACAGLPTSGPVAPGLPAGADAGSPDFSFRPDSPQPGATPEQIVTGFHAVQIHFVMTETRDVGDCADQPGFDCEFLS